MSVFRQVRIVFAVSAAVLAMLVALPSSADTQTGVTWGLDRIDQRALPLNGSYTYNATGADVNVYVVGTGIRPTHTEFGGRASVAFDSVGDGRNGIDCNGQSTHVAGTIGGRTYGVAKGVTLRAVRVLNCQGSGTQAAVIAGVDWVRQNHVRPAVAVVLATTTTNAALDTAVRNAIASGVTVVVPAANAGADACGYSPGRVPEAITVGATTTSDARPTYSNTGTCLDLFAPGENITSAWNSSDTATNTIRGTSMAAAHVGGAAALYLQGNPTASPSAVRDALFNNATNGVVSAGGEGSPNKLLYTGPSSNPPPPPPPTPTPTGCGLPEKYNGSLSGTNDADLHPNGTYFFTANAGTHRGCLRGPSGTDFDVALYRWSGIAWTRVASGTGTTSNEDVTYSGTSGYYYWRVYSYSGAGSYAFEMQRP